MAAFYVVVNVCFAVLYWLAGADALAGAARAPLARFEDSLFFSVQTLATIGYGRLVPNTRLANILVALEALVGLLGFAILSGLLFARFTRPTAKIVFSRNADHRTLRHGMGADVPTREPPESRPHRCPRRRVLRTLG